MFAGPLDLLWYLVRKQELDILDIPIARVTEQYLEMLAVLEVIDVNAVGDFLELATRLMEIKSRMMLPRHEEDQQAEEQVEDPRNDIVQRLLEYKKYKDAASMLAERGQLWQQRFGQIRDFEELLAVLGTIVLKYFLHISRDEQEERLLEREKEPETAWKLNPNDWKERDHWDEYTAAYEDAISKTAAPHAPWIIVPANSKWYRNLVVAESIVDTLREHRKNWDKKLEEMGRAGRAGLEAYRAQLGAKKKNSGKRR